MLVTTVYGHVPIPRVLLPRAISRAFCRLAVDLFFFSKNDKVDIVRVCCNHKVQVGNFHFTMSHGR